MATAAQVATTAAQVATTAAQAAITAALWDMAVAVTGGKLTVLPNRYRVFQIKTVTLK